MKEAPLFISTYDLYSWLLDRAGRAQGHPVIRRSLLEHSRALLHAVSLALSRFDTSDRLVEADEHATLLRLHLRLARDKEILNDRQLLYAIGELREIGRQIGGWRKHLRRLE